jgi:hypothetical protein
MYLVVWTSEKLELVEFIVNFVFVSILKWFEQQFSPFWICLGSLFVVVDITCLRMSTILLKFVICWRWLSCQSALLQVARIFNFIFINKWIKMTIIIIIIIIIIIGGYQWTPKKKNLLIVKFVKKLNICFVIIDASLRDACLDTVFWVQIEKMIWELLWVPKRLDIKQFGVFKVRKRTRLPFHSWRFVRIIYAFLGLMSFLFVIMRLVYFVVQLPKTKNLWVLSLCLLVCNFLSIFIYWCGLPCSLLGIICFLWESQLD